MRIVLDTSVLISAVVFAGKTPRNALERILTVETLLLSSETQAEWMEVMGRSKFDFRRDREGRMRFLADIIDGCEFVPVTSVVHDCDDPKDDHLLALALDGRADVLVTGDAHLLKLDPWRGVAILTPAQFLART